MGSFITYKLSIPQGTTKYLGETDYPTRYTAVLTKVGSELSWGTWSVDTLVKLANDTTICLWASCLSDCVDKWVPSAQKCFPKRESTEESGPFPDLKHKNSIVKWEFKMLKIAAPYIIICKLTTLWTWIQCKSLKFVGEELRAWYGYNNKTTSLISLNMIFDHLFWKCSSKYGF